MTPDFFYKVIVWQQAATFPSSYAQTIFLTISQELPIILILRWTKKTHILHVTGKGKSVPLQAGTGPEGS